jgi:hypothetical protein
LLVDCLCREADQHIEPPSGLIIGWRGDIGQWLA